MSLENEEGRSDDLRDDDAEANAAFEASFNGKEAPPAKQPTEKAQPEQKDATAAADEAAKEAAKADDKAASASATAPNPEQQQTTEQSASAEPPAPRFVTEEALRREVDRLQGRFGEVIRTLQELKTTKEAAGKPAVATQVELARMKAEYPELAEVLTEDLAKTLGGLAGTQADPKAIEEIVTQRVQEGVAREAARLRDAAVDDAHPNWRTDLFTVDAATGQKKPSADYLAWRATLKPEEATAFENTDNPYLMVRRLNEFYEFKGKATKAQAEREARLKAAVQPQGVPRASPPQLSEREAEMKGFLEGFNS